MIEILFDKQRIAMDMIQHFSIEHFVGIKAVHILAATLWAFATAGPMLFYVMPAMADISSDPENPELERRGNWVLEQFDRTVILEHVSFVVILFTGALLYSTGIAGLRDGWFLAKMSIVIGFFIPLEIYDIWLSHFKAPRMTRTKDADPIAYAAFRKFYYKYLKFLGIPILLTVPTVLILALTKPF